MIQEQIGDGSDLAEIIIDYKKKDIKILDGERGDKITHHDLNIENLFTLIIFTIIYIAFYFITETVNEFKLLTLGYSLVVTFHLLVILVNPIGKKFHKWWQFVSNDFFKVKKMVIVKKLYTKTYKLPHKFRNIKLDYKLYKEFGKYIKKIHIKPVEVYVKRKKEYKRQTDDWEAYFYFEKIPKRGKMIIEFI